MPPVRPIKREGALHLACAALVGAISIGVYASTFDAEFAFDDNFAILYNGANSCFQDAHTVCGF